MLRRTRRPADRRAGRIAAPRSGARAHRARRPAARRRDTRATVAEIFTRLGLRYTRDGEDFVVTPPSYRFDLAIEEDFVEEVARLYGYDHIPAAPAAQAQAMSPEPEAIRSTTD